MYLDSRGLNVISRGISLDLLCFGDVTDFFSYLVEVYEA